jgi:hypothetical protein
MTLHGTLSDELCRLTRNLVHVRQVVEAIAIKSHERGERQTWPLLGGVVEELNAITADEKRAAERAAGQSDPDEQEDGE